MALDGFVGTDDNIRRTMPPAARARAARSVGSGIIPIATGFAIVLGVGFLLLMTPIASTNGEWTNPNTALFTAVSALCVTGLVLVDTQTHYSWFGELVILVLIQIGGLGYMVGTTVILWALGRRLGLRDQQMLRLYYGAPTMRETFSFTRAVALFTLRFEAAGAVILFFAFWYHGVPIEKAWWWGIFHAVSAFNNAGFNITANDMVGFTGAPVVLLTLASLIVVGGLGYLPLVNLWARRSFRKLSLDSKLIILTSAALLVAGLGFTLAMEWGNDETLGPLSPDEKATVALFHSANSRTAGFSAVDQAELHDGTKVATVGLMFVGGGAGSTAGGLKVGAFALLFVVMLATLRGQETVSVFRRRIPELFINQATTLALYFVALVFGFSFLLSTTTDQDFVDVIFEAVSALCTVGLSAAGTPSFGTDGHYVLMLAMLVGRFSPLMIVLYMTKPRRKLAFQHPEDSVRLG